ncbi:MAG TPA: glycosyltransferase family 2 protein [Solirubrobacterales bacterium]|jgi:glycosyltransferase involved in cell wall biosynthesis|nr:glycosyltransferase family 2 protein [Solirubrobacterales bacterium]
MSRVLLITPARDEAAHLENTIRAVAAQSRLPDLWLIIDDGSSDETPAILERQAAELPFLELRRTPVRDAGGDADGLAVAAEARAFNAALATVDPAEFTHIGKLDADIELPSDYLEGLLDRFAADPRLGVGGGILLERNGGEWRPTSVPAYHVRGALKLYNRACFEAIGGIEERLGWDTIDETYARMHGFATRSFPELPAHHHRPVATRGGALRGRARHGQCAYILRYGLPWVFARSFKVAAQKPYVLSGFAFFYGYLKALLKAQPKVEDNSFKRFVRRELRGRAMPGSSFFQPTETD